MQRIFLINQICSCYYKLCMVHDSYKRVLKHGNSIGSTHFHIERQFQPKSDFGQPSPPGKCLLPSCSLIWSYQCSGKGWMFYLHHCLKQREAVAFTRELPFMSIMKQISLINLPCCDVFHSQTVTIIQYLSFRVEIYSAHHDTKYEEILIWFKQ